MDKLKYVIDYLKKVNNINSDLDYNFNTFRALMNITMPDNLSDEYYASADEVLQEMLKSRNIKDATSLNFNHQIAIYQGDITKIKADAIVNACNNELLGCFHPLHGCVDNAIHSFGGLQLRRDLMKIMKDKKQEENGLCEVTKGYNLPSKYVFHTVGPKVFSGVTNDDIIDLKNCYLSCLKKANELQLKTIVFSLISTGIYNFPKPLASQIAINSVFDYINKTKSNILVVFDCFTKEDYLIYEQELRKIIK